MSFSQQISGFGVKATQRIQNVRRGVVIKLMSAVVLDTPVDEGRARGGWQVSADKPVTTENERLDKSGRGPIAEIETAAKASDGDTPLFLSNSVPYIQNLEEGSSGQAPEGMVRRNVARFGRLVKVEVASKSQ